MLGPTGRGLEVSTDQTGLVAVAVEAAWSGRDGPVAAAASIVQDQSQG